MQKSFFISIYSYLYQFSTIGLYFGTRSFHDAPADKVSNGTDAEYDEVSGCLAFESHEYHLGFISVNEQFTEPLLMRNEPIPPAIPPNW